MLHGASPEQLQAWSLTEPDDYHYLNTSGMVRVPQLDDKAELLGFSTACEAMALQVSEREQLLQCMAGVLHLGNIEFDDGSGDATGPAVAIAARSSLPNISEISGGGGGGGDGGGGGGGELAPRAAVRAD